ncbi:MAG: transcription antitermination factor NusB [Nitrospira sp.]|nr:transcription antitermination factor NusB [Nitrospira sp.]
MAEPQEREYLSSSRTKGRELALKLLYLADLSGRATASAQVPELLESETDSAAVREFAKELFEGIEASVDEVDALLESAALNWQVSRMPYVDRAILRMGAYELMKLHDVPPKVTISEAIELARRYSTEKSSSFINGVLDKIYQTHCPEKV